MTSTPEQPQEDPVMGQEPSETEPSESEPAATTEAGGEQAGDEAPAQSKLDEEGDAAADYLEELLDIADLDGDIDIEVKGGRVYVSISSEEGTSSLESLVGQDSATLEALQELTRLAVLSSTGQRSRFVLDIDGHRARRADALKVIVGAAIASVKADGESVALKPMSAYERKMVHDLIAEADLVSDSEGEGPQRHVVVHASED